MSYPYGPERIHPDHVNIQTDEIDALRRENAELKRQLAIAQDAEKLQALKLQSAIKSVPYPAAQIREARP